MDPHAGFRDAYVAYVTDRPGEVIVGFAGEDIDAAKYYPEDDKYLIERENFVTHYEVS